MCLPILFSIVSINLPSANMRLRDFFGFLLRPFIKWSWCKPFAVLWFGGSFKRGSYSQCCFTHEFLKSVFQVSSDLCKLLLFICSFCSLFHWNFHLKWMIWPVSHKEMFWHVSFSWFWVLCMPGSKYFFLLYVLLLSLDHLLARLTGFAFRCEQGAVVSSCVFS